ncbi:hypothetical protein F2Q69_00038278 [Brassica cretica]|uniref:Uncharacterized protein n=1 Tax=Brassica cretica TaxID=69181 RepID=A0A8S9SQQ3_BRACR|nr:hypothetical protein F2Q69_00038278 [Brassica cretica]
MFLGIFRGTAFLGNFRGPRSSEIPDANSEKDFVGTSEDWTIGNFLGIYRGSPPSVYSEELSDDLVVLGVSSEIQFLGIPSEISEGFPRKNEFPRSYFRGLFSSWNTEARRRATTAQIRHLRRYTERQGENSFIQNPTLKADLRQRHLPDSTRCDSKSSETALHGQI